jgi:hypothetical protein
MSRLKIGRSAGSDIVINHDTVSRTHAEIESLGGGRYLLNDLGSTSGTQAFIAGNWVPARNIEVDENTRVALGDHETTVAALLGAAPGNVATRPPKAVSPLPRPPVVSEAGETAAAVTPRGPGAAARPKLGSKSGTTFWLFAAGGAALLLVVIALVLALVLDGGSTSNMSGSTVAGGPERERFIAACRKAAKSMPPNCACVADLILAEFSGRDRELFLKILEAGRAADPQQILTSQSPMDAARFMEKFLRFAPKLERCAR